MPDPDSVFLVSPYNDPVVIKINGRASYTNSGPLRDFFNRLIRQGRRQFLIDFSNCTTIDSTFLGIIAGAAIDLQEQPEPGVIKLSQLGPRNEELVRNLGIDRITQVENRVPRLEDFVTLKPDRANEEERANMILDAHLKLVECDGSNSARFQDVISFLRQQTDRE